MLFIVVFSAASSQQITLNCSFFIAQFINYGCDLMHIEVLDQSSTVSFAGDHLSGRNNTDVNYVRIRDSNTPFMIQEIFTTFSNIMRLEIFNSNLTSISIPESVQLNWLALNGNNITRIERDSLSNQSNLGYFNLAANNIEHIDEEAFKGLSSVDSFVMNNNRIRELAPRTFHPLSYVMSMDLAGNLLTRISEGLFSNNINLLHIYLEHNQINEIHPRFADNLRESLRFINLLDNICVDVGFTFYDDNAWSLMNKELTTCFNNFNVTTPGRRRITMEFEGPLSLFDEDGNLIIAV